MGAVELAFAFAYLYAGATLRTALPLGAVFLLRVLLAGVAFRALLMLIDVVTGLSVPSIALGLLGLAFNGYLFANVRRLAREARSATATVAA